MSAVRYLLFPALVTLLTLFALHAPGWDWPRTVALSGDGASALLPLLAIVSFYPTVAMLERVLPFRAAWNRAHDDVRTDTLHLLLTGPLSSGLYDATLRGTFAAGGTWLTTRVDGGLWPAHWPALGQLGLALLVAEFGHYWFHRLSHENALVWRLHATHHSALRLYWLNATRFHPFDLLALLICQITPLLLLGISPEALLSYTLFATVYGQFQHCNVDLRTWRAVDWVFSTPGLHRWHHSTDPREGNNNYGAILSAWDLLFGTFFRPADRACAARVGIANLPDFPTGYGGQLLSPVRWARLQPAARALTS